MFIIDTIDNNWEFWECHYISLFKSWGFNLTNHENGGNSGAGLVCTSTRKLLSNSLKGNKNKLGAKLNLEQRKNYGNGRRGKHNSQEHKDLVSKKIEQYDKKGNFIRLWDSIKQAETILKIKNVSLNCNGHRKHLLDLSGNLKIINYEIYCNGYRNHWFR